MDTLYFAAGRMNNLIGQRTGLVKDWKPIAELSTARLLPLQRFRITTMRMMRTASGMRSSDIRIRRAINNQTAIKRCDSRSAVSGLGVAADDFRLHWIQCIVGSRSVCDRLSNAKPKIYDMRHLLPVLASRDHDAPVI